MTTADQLDRVVADPIGLITDLVADVEKELDPETIRAVVTTVAGGRAKSRTLAAALNRRPALLDDGRSPAPRALGDLLIALRQAGAQAISPPSAPSAANTCARSNAAARTGTAESADPSMSIAPLAGRTVASPPGTGPASRDA